MYSFPELIKNIRVESGLTQSSFAKALGVSTILISMIESGQKEVSKNFILKLSDKLGVHPSSITPFLFAYKTFDRKKFSIIERKLVEMGEDFQSFLIKKKAKILKKYVQEG